MVVHNHRIKTLMKDIYTVEDLESIHSLLSTNGTFEFTPYPNGLFPASLSDESQSHTGYDNVWVRDNVHIAYAHHINGYNAVTQKNVDTLIRYFIKHRSRFERIITGEADFRDVMNRPHVRFRGTDLTELGQKWPHAQNDALGYFLWFLTMLRRGQGVRHSLSDEERGLIALFVRYFETIEYWHDEDSGHWEEVAKVEASSIGVVVAALRQVKTLMIESDITFEDNYGRIDLPCVDELIDKGTNSLENILPFECRQKERGCLRLYDSALLFLIFPLGVIRGEMADRVCDNVREHLLGDYGIRRYIGDSFWAGNYRRYFSIGSRTADFSDNIASRDSILKVGEEAQWCLFDPVMSVIYGQKYLESRNTEDLEQQIFHFNRSLGQLTGEDSSYGGFKCPELYYLENGTYVSNETVPLLWTQANLMNAFTFMKQSLCQVTI